MKILYDHLCFNEKYGGVSKYFIKMINSLPTEVKYELVIRFSSNEYVAKIKQNGVIRLFGGKNFRGKASLLNFINKPYSIRSLKSGDYDIYHKTHYDTYGHKYANDKKIIVTIHDMNCFKIPHYYNSKYVNNIKKLQKVSTLRADKIIAVSDNTKNDLCEYLGISENKITTIYHGIDIATNNNTDRSVFNYPYLLFVGARYSYKNFDNLVRVFKNISAKYTDLFLICTGNSFTLKEQKMIHDFNLHNKIIHISASEEMMNNLYSNAELFIYPSYYEGFGMPLLEAMSCACPVACSNTSCFPEIAHNAAVYFDPHSIDNMTETVFMVLSDNVLKEKMKKNGIEQVKLFSWKKCASAHLNVYSEIMEV